MAAKQAIQLALTVTSCWASTKPGQTKFHYYDGDGLSLCSYERKTDTLTPWGDPGRMPPQACSSCKLHFQRGDHLAAAAPAAAVVLPAEARVRVIKGTLRGAFGRIQRYDEQNRKYCVAFGKKFEFLLPTDIEEAPL